MPASDIETHAPLLTPSPLRHRGIDFTPQDPCHAGGNTFLHLILPQHAAQPLSQALDLQAHGDPLDQLQGVDTRADFFQQAPDEAGLAHAVIEQVVPEAGVVLLLGEGDGLGDVV